MRFHNIIILKIPEAGTSSCFLCRIAEQTKPATSKMIQFEVQLMHGSDGYPVSLIYPVIAAEVTVDASALKEGDVAGLCAFQGCYAAVGITKHHGKYEVLMLDKKEDGILDMTEGTVVESHQMDFRLEA